MTTEEEQIEQRMKNQRTTQSIKEQLQAFQFAKPVVSIDTNAA
jgi:hypothetical protein